METGSTLQILVYINAGILISVITIGYKVIKFFSNIEFKTDLMWADYKRRHNYPEE